MMKEKILVFIPSYRCEKQICRVLDQFDSSVQKCIDTVMVVDNQSPDRTLEVAINHGKAILTNCNFIAWRNDNNYGLGGSHKVAFIYAIKKDFDYLVVLHGDDQADIRDLLPLLDSKIHHEFECLLGARFMTGSQLGGYSWFRTFGNRVYNALFSLVVFRAIYDLGSGLNLYKLKSFKDLYFKSFPDDLTFNYVMLLASYFRKQRILYFPISWREEDQRSNVKLFRQAIKVLALLISFARNQGQFIEMELRSHVFCHYSGQIIHSHNRKIR